MSYSDTNWSQRSRHTDPSRSLHGRIPLLSRHSSYDDTQYNKTLSKLIDRFDTFSETFTPQEQLRQKEKLIERFGRILSSQREPSVEQDEHNVVYSLHSRLEATEGSDSAFRFGHLYNKLASQDRLRNKWSMLYLFSLLDPDNLATLDSPPVRGLQSIDLDIQPVPTFQSHNSPRTTRRKLTQDIPPSIQLAKARERHNQIYVSESDLLRDLIFVFQGIDGQYIRFDPTTNENFLLPNISLSKPTQDMVNKLAETGYLYMKISNFVKNNVSCKSLVGQSLCAAIQKELKEYYKLIAVLEAQIEKQVKSEIVTEQSLTLKRVLVWTYECNRKLKLLNIFADTCQDQKGGALLSHIHNYTKHGDPFTRKYLVDILQTISMPFYEMLERWVYEGELDDPYDEFFVACDDTVSEEELWQSKYTIRQDMLPTFMSEELANKIFSIGKSLNFIRYSCHNEHSTIGPREKFKYGEMDLVEKSIEAAYTETSRSLLTILKTKYKLMDHLKALKRYLLLGQGDFIQYLMDVLWVNLSKPANTLFRHNLTGILETAVRSSNTQYDDPDIINRLDVRLLEIQKDDLGWDVFSLEYHVDAPINTVFSPSSMQEYLKIFTFLWRLKRVEYTLSEAWRQWGKAQKEYDDIKKDVQNAQLTIQRMIHFIYQLQHYVLFEVLECSWKKLETFIETKSIDLDSIIDAHAKYLSEITEKGFLSGYKGEALASRLSSIFDSILKYSQLLGRRRKDMSKRHKEIQDHFTLQVLEFLRLLDSYHDEDLRSLSTRLDYNDFYSRVY